MAGATFLSKYRKFGTVRRVSLSWWTGRRDPSSKILFRRAVHVQSFQSPCMCTKMRVRIFCLTGEERAKQELQNAFLDESPTQNEAKIQPFKVRILFVIFARNLPIEMVYFRCWQKAQRAFPHLLELCDDPHTTRKLLISRVRCTNAR